MIPQKTLESHVNSVKVSEYKANTQKNSGICIYQQQTIQNEIKKTILLRIPSKTK